MDFVFAVFLFYFTFWKLGGKFANKSRNGRATAHVFHANAFHPNGRYI